MKEPKIEPTGGSDSAAIELNDPVAAEPLSHDAEIVSVNSKNTPGNTAGKTLFVLACSALLVGLLAWLGQNYLNTWKQSAKGPKREFGAEVDPLNPEATRGAVQKVGAATGKPPPQAPAPPTPRPGAPENDGMRPIRGADGKVLTDPQGRALGIDPTGKIMAVPAIATLPAPAVPAGTAQAAVPPPPSRYGGSLFVDAKTLGSIGSANSSQPGAPGQQATPVGNTSANSNQQIELLKTLMGAANQKGGSASTAPVVSTAPVATTSPYVALPDPIAVGSGPASAASFAPGAAPSMTTVASTQANTATPTVKARMFPDQNLMIPKGRQAGCVLTTRVDDQLPGYTSCTLLDDLYSDNGKTLLLEHGSDFWGEYGTIGEPGLSRIAVNWVRIKTRDGITVDLSSPGTDALGGSGLPGHYNPRWGERIGAAVLISLVKDVTAAIITNQTKGASSGGTNVSVSPPGQNTIGGTSNLADQVVRETLRVRPNVTIAEGTRISIYVNRDLDFRTVYELRHAGDLAKASPQ